MLQDLCLRPFSKVRGRAWRGPSPGRAGPGGNCLYRSGIPKSIKKSYKTCIRWYMYICAIASFLRTHDLDDWQTEIVTFQKIGTNDIGLSMLHSSEGGRNTTYIVALLRKMVYCSFFTTRILFSCREFGTNRRDKIWRCAHKTRRPTQTIILD
jgi:hypothetical protein